MSSNPRRPGQLAIAAARRAARPVLAAILATACASNPAKISPGKATPPATIEAVAVFPFASRMRERPGVVFQKTWDLLEAVRRQGTFVANGPREFERNRDAATEPYRASTLLLTAQALGLDPANIVVLAGGATERVQRTGTVVEGEAGNIAGLANASKSTVVADLSAINPSQRAVILTAQHSAEEDMFEERPRHDSRPTLTKVWLAVVQGAIEGLADRAPGADPARDWGFDALENPLAVLAEDPGLANLEPKRRKERGDDMLRYFHPQAGASLLESFRRAPPHALVVTAVGGDRPGQPPEGLAVGDVVTKVDGKPVLGAWHLDRCVRFAGKTPQLALTVVRSGVEKSLTWKP